VRSAAAWPHDGVLHAWWVVPGRLLVGEYPASLSPGTTAEKIRLLVEAGVESIVDLTTPEDRLGSYQEALNVAAQKVLRPIRHITHPIPDMGVLDQEGYDRIIACIRDEIDTGRTVYVHCWGGKGRTGTVVGCLLIDGGLDYDGAIKRIAELRAGTRKASEPCPESSAQHRVLRERAGLLSPRASVSWSQGDSNHCVSCRKMPWPAG
jgi:protein-tyrosine phosphatase